MVYIVKEPGYNAYMDAQQTLNLQLMRELAALGVDFAFPTRTVYLAPGSEASALTRVSADADAEADANSGASRAPLRRSLN